ncbi:hypothetical protein [Tenacibaculum finnmarkense]|uniref:hypothetical protein n=1 Tax=Tenacibaculum finnmarkense TaxID=2781243 RepID=UPI00207976BC|nr:hypothetical protein [Tenacibaculum finnmarkense]MCM8906785.1 hypothetical protein [Tenacibaculum finnmarkense genomovar finnmarkense]
MRLKIDGEYYNYFTTLAINLKLDSIASLFSFNVRFNPDNETHRKLFQPLTYKTVQLYNDSDEVIFTGTILVHKFNSKQTPELLSLSGYSLPGILEDVTIPVTSYPLESINRSLKDIATRLLGLFNIKLIIDKSAMVSADVIYKKSVASPTESIKSYLSKLTSQRNLVLSHTAKGEVVIYKPDVLEPVYIFNDSNTLTMSFDVNGQVMHSKISVIRQPSESNSGVSTVDTVDNSLVSLFRPKTKVLSSGEDTDVKNAADNELANELKAINLSISLDRVVEVLLPGVIVEVINPEIFIYTKTKFMVIDVVIKGAPNNETSDVKLVLPETFTSQIPSKIFEI